MKNKKTTKMRRSELNEMINYKVDQKVINYLVESQGLDLQSAIKNLQDRAQKGFSSLKSSCKDRAVKTLIFVAIKSLQGAYGLLDGEAQTDMGSIVNILMTLTAEQTGNNTFAYTRKPISEGLINESLYFTKSDYNLASKGLWPFNKKSLPIKSKLGNVNLLAQWGNEDCVYDLDPEKASMILNDDSARFYYYVYNDGFGGGIQSVGIIALSSIDDEETVQSWPGGVKLASEYSDDSILVESIIEIQRDKAIKLYNRHKNDFEKYGY